MDLLVVESFLHIGLLVVDSLFLVVGPGIEFENTDQLDRCLMEPAEIAEKISC